jgi:sugar phosphate isomerase/epimerase
MLRRRNFLGGLGVAALGGWASPAGAARLETIGLQLYTVRRDLEKDFDGTLAQVAKVGFREAELAGLFGRTPKDVRASLERHGLKAPSMHADLPEIESGFSRTLEAGTALGVRYVICAWLAPEERGSLDDYKKHADTFNRAGEEAKKAGIQFGFHCHDFEFVPLDGVVPYDLLLKETDASLVQMEMDLYWISKAGADPLHYFQQYPGRFPLVHVKDMDRTPQKFFTEVGKGVVDFRRVFAQASLGGIRHYFVEQDETPGPAIDSARESYQYLQSLDF